MGLIRHVESRDQHRLRARNLVGRSRKCALALRDAAVSGEHATIWWSTVGWRLRDLGSRNGTLLNGERLDPGQTMTLSLGDRVVFGRETHAWTVVDLAPPGASATALDDDGTAHALDGVLALPPGADPTALVSFGPDGWQLETESGVTDAEDEQILTLPTGRWRLHLPEALPGTREATSALVGHADTCSLHFRVSLDEEHVQLEGRLAGQHFDLGSRAHNYLLLTLARARTKDAADPTLPESAHGWVHIEDLIRMLGASETNINVQVFRARKAAVKAGLGQRITIIERRSRTAQMRIGVAALDMTTI